jgi:type I restriction enzyme S subunit
VLEPTGRGLLPELLPFLCQTEAFYQHALKTSAGGLSPRTNWKDLAKYELALPPLDEQGRILEVLTLHDRSVDALQAVRTALGRLRESSLASAFPPRMENGTGPTLQHLLDAGTLNFQTGPFGTVLAATEYTEAGWPIVNPTDIREGLITHTSGPCVSDVTASRLVKYRMIGGDVLLARKGEIDKACIADSAHDGWVVGSDCIRLRCDESALIPEYLLFFLQSPSTSRMLSSYAHGTVMPGLNEKMLARLTFGVPSRDEQLELIRRIDAVDLHLEQARIRVQQIRMFRQAALRQLL